MAKGRAPSGQALAVPATPANAVDGPSGFDPSRIRVGDEVEYFIEGGWTVEDGKRVDRERAKVRVVKLYDPPKHGEYRFGIMHAGSAHEGLLRLSEVTAHFPCQTLAEFGQHCFCGCEVVEGSEAWMHGFCDACWREINLQLGAGA